MKNQILIGTPTSPRFAPCPSTVKAGDPVLLGIVPAVALDDYQANEGGTTFYTNGTFALTVVGTSSISPVANEKISAGQQLYAFGTLDPTTNVTTGLTINATAPPQGIAFGVLDPQYPGAPVASGATDTAAWVRL
jgi:predicted RecA/RadA family phage recombinase